MSFWDTSSLAKLHLQESDSALFRGHAANASAPPVVARLAILEMQRVARFKEASGQLAFGEAERILRSLAEDVARGDISVAEFSDAASQAIEDVMRVCYSQSPPVLLRTADAIHLGCARVAGETEVVTTDGLMRTAATILGFKLFPPDAPPISTP